MQIYPRDMEKTEWSLMDRIWSNYCVLVGLKSMRLESLVCEYFVSQVS